MTEVLLNNQENLLTNEYQILGNLLRTGREVSGRLYTSYAPQHPRINGALSSVDNFTSPYLEKCTTVVDAKLAPVVAKLLPLSKTYLQKGQNLSAHYLSSGRALTNNYLKNPINNSLVLVNERVSSTKNRLTGLSESLLSKVESHVEQLTSSLQKPSQEERSEARLAESIVLHEKSSAKERVQNVLRKIQELVTLFTRRSLQAARSARLEQVARNVKDIINTKFQLLENYENLKILSEIALQLFKENLYQPSVELVTVRFSKSKDQVTLTLHNINRESIKELLPKLKQRFSYLRSSVVEFYKNKLVVKLNKETFNEYSSRVKQDINNVLQEARNYDFRAIDVKKSSKDIYAQAVKAIRDRQSALHKSYNSVVLMINERKSAARFEKNEEVPLKKEGTPVENNSEDDN